MLANLAPDDKASGSRSRSAISSTTRTQRAYRAEIVLDMIETTTTSTARSKEFSGDRVGNGKIDGYYKGPDGRGDPFGDNTHSRRIKSGSEAERFEKFLEEGYDVFEHDIPLDPPPTDLRDGHSAQAAAEKLRDAVADGDPERAAELIEAGADPGADANPEAKAGGPVSVLELAAVHDPEVARAMLEAMPADRREELLNDVGADGNTAMHAIAASGDAELYEDAQDWGGRTDAVNDAAYTPDDIHDHASEIIAEHEEEHGKLDKRSDRGIIDQLLDIPRWSGPAENLGPQPPSVALSWRRSCSIPRAARRKPRRGGAHRGSGPGRETHRRGCRPHRRDGP